MSRQLSGRMSLARRVSWSVVIGGTVVALIAMLIIPGGSRHLPWLAMISMVNGVLLFWNWKKGFAVFDAGEEVVFSVAFGVFCTMLFWAWVIGP